MPFRFRAQAALDLRQRELGDAQRQLARAEEVRDRARRALGEADQAAAAARQAAGEAQTTPGEAARLEWYRLWIVRLDHERAAVAATLAARDRDVAEAAGACQRARQRKESLERFREKAFDAHVAAELAAERKSIDELAARRFSRYLREDLT